MQDHQWKLIPNWRDGSYYWYVCENCKLYKVKLPDGQIVYRNEIKLPADYISCNERIMEQILK